VENITQFCWNNIQQWKNFENRLRFEKVIAKSLVASSLGHGVHALSLFLSSLLLISSGIESNSTQDHLTSQYELSTATPLFYPLHSTVLSDLVHLHKRDLFWPSKTWIKPSNTSTLSCVRMDGALSDWFLSAMEYGKVALLHLLCSSSQFTGFFIVWTTEASFGWRWA